MYGTLLGALPVEACGWGGQLQQPAHLSCHGVTVVGVTTSVAARWLLSSLRGCGIAVLCPVPGVLAAAKELQHM
jgi:hypothetical protein